MSNKGRATIAKERKRNTGDGKKTNGHANIKDYIKSDGADEA